MNPLRLNSLLLSLFLLILFPGKSFSQLNKSAANEYVILLHGLARSSNSMKKMEKALQQQGYRTCNISYPSTSYPIDELTENHVLPKILKCLPNQTVRLSFVTHSMGGIIVRNLFKQHNKFKNLNSVVMLSPPNQGSEVVDRLGDFALFSFINGPAGQELATSTQGKPKALGPANFRLGIITGNRSINLILSILIPGPDDGKVSVKSAQLQGMSDFLVLPVSHPFIMKNKEAIEQTVYFLKLGRFRHPIENLRAD